MPRSARRRNPDRRVPVKGGAEYAGVCEKTIRNWYTAGLITGYRKGPKLIEVDLDEIDRIIRPVPTAGNGAA